MAFLSLAEVAKRLEAEEKAWQGRAPGKDLTWRDWVNAAERQKK